MKYVALLRGVNVGGNHRVPKAEFRMVLEELGFHDVIIYINSGNAVFSYHKKVSSQVVRAALEKHFGFSIPTLILSGERICAIAAAIPQEWTNDPPKPDKSGQKSDVLYLFDEVNTETILQDIGYKSDIETMKYVDGAVLANITRKHQSRGSLQKITGSRIYSNVTIRNITTAKKLAELAKE